MPVDTYTEENTHCTVLDPLVLDPARKPLRRCRIGLVFTFCVLGRGLRDEGALVLERAKDLRVTGTGKEDE